MDRQVILDTETTGLSFREGDRVIEIACIELIEGRQGEKFHTWVNPEREVSKEAQAIHGKDTKFLRHQPLFKDVADELIKFLRGASLIAHNAPFDIGFIDKEFELAQRLERIDELCPKDKQYDTLAIARKMYPGAAVSLDALCRRYQIDLSGREKHDAMLDVQLLMKVWQHMNSRQSNFNFSNRLEQQHMANTDQQPSISGVQKKANLLVRLANEDELKEHESYLLEQGEKSVWRKMQHR